MNVIGMSKMKPPISELLPRLTPILKNRHEKVRLIQAYILLYSCDNHWCGASGVFQTTRTGWCQCNALNSRRVRAVVAGYGGGWVILW